MPSYKDADALRNVFTEKSTENVLGIDLCKAIISRIDQMPTADVVPVKHGRWFEYDTDDQYDEIQCPHCKHLYVVDAYRFADIGITKDDLRYCPNCGAKMDGENDG